MGQHRVVDSLSQHLPHIPTFVSLFLMSRSQNIQNILRFLSISIALIPFYQHHLHCRISMKVCFANSLLRPRRNGCVNCSSCEQSNGGSGEKDPKYLRLLQFSLLQSHINQIFFMFLRPEVQSHFHFLMSPLFLECQSEACQASPHLLWSRSVFPCCQF